MFQRKEKNCNIYNNNEELVETNFNQKISNISIRKMSNKMFAF